MEITCRLSSILSHDNFIPVSKVLTSKIGLLEAALFGELCSESDYWHEHNGITEDGYFFSTVENIESKLSIKRKIQEKLVKNLIGYGLISVIKKGLPAKRYIKINEEKLLNLLVQNDLSSTSQKDELVRSKNTTNKTIHNKTIHNDKEEIYKEEKNKSAEICYEFKDGDVDDIDKFMKVLDEWFEYKRSRKNMYKTQQGVTKFIQTLIRYSNRKYELAQEIVDISIANNYQGIFPLKGRVV